MGQCKFFVILPSFKNFDFISNVLSIKGQTGFPWIDAIMTQLREEGWIHHLARHAVACFLTRGDLWISWEEGMKVFVLQSIGFYSVFSDVIDICRYLKSCCWMQIGLSMRAPGCGCHVRLSFTNSFTAIALSDLAGKWIPTGISSSNHRDYFHFYFEKWFDWFGLIFQF